jgi:hypothetical protein
MVSFPKPRLPRTFRSIVVNEDSHDTRWSNPDIVPVPKEERKYTSKAFFGYWYGPSINPCEPQRLMVPGSPQVSTPQHGLLALRISPRGLMPAEQ